ncbi:bifunctional hydroxymethylpyrimidine kinase/phosphomethylpyrimidine kinase [Fontibacillus sp. BL9]|uniref:bifunctional hydroxymethylpyrimidine kinase/phosphomethylpyrimidine kinase n=1 Tax=Fontibacillus sp. BL9 TaxID=3389971 RepID=UPI00397CBDB0
MTGLRISKALTIAGSDSGGGAGIQADLKTFQELDVYGMSAITAITVQNTLGVSGVYPLPPEAAAEQIRAVGSDLGVDAVKTGMLFDAGIIRAVSAEIRKFGWERVVVDPVMIAKGGAELLRQEAVLALKEELLPLALVVTPNIPEAEVLAGMTISTMQDRREAAKIISAMGPKLVVIKGGHDGGDGKAGKVANAMNAVKMVNGGEDGNAGGNVHEGIYQHGLHGSMEVVDLLYDGSGFTELSGKRIHTVHTHGTGCTYSAALTAGLAKGLPAPEAISLARDFIQAAIEDVLELGHGHGPTNHWAYRRRMAVSAR